MNSKGLNLQFLQKFYVQFLQKAPKNFIEVRIQNRQKNEPKKVYNIGIINFKREIILIIKFYM